MLAVDTSPWVSLSTAVVISLGFLFQIILSLMAKFEAAKNAKAMQIATEAVRVEAVITATNASANAKMVQEAAIEAATRADEVKVALESTTQTVDIKLSALSNVATATHALVNNAMSQQLRINANLAAKVAELTKMPEDIKLAVLAKKASETHDRHQAEIDSPK